MDVIVLVPVPGLGDVPDPDLEAVLVPSLRIVPIPRRGTDLVPLQKNATGTRANLVVAVVPSPLSVPGPDRVLGPGPVPALVVNQMNGRETIRMLLTNQKRMVRPVTMTVSHVRDPPPPRRVLRIRTARCVLVATRRRRMTALMNEEKTALSSVYS